MIGGVARPFAVAASSAADKDEDDGVIPTPIDGARLLGDLHRLREFGPFRTGVHRPPYTEVDMDSRRWLMERMRQAGLEPEIDGIGNVLGRGPAAPTGKRLLLGSHTETQNESGWLDGALGVMVGLEVARTLGAGIDVAAFADEEGHYGRFHGSRSFVGDLPDAEIDAARNKYHGLPLREALQAAGLGGKERLRVKPGEYLGYLEAHIEQGAELDDTGDRIGVVTAIFGNWGYRIGFEGVQNHAGTTRMAIRKDAGVALVKLAAAIETEFPKVASPRSVWTTGRITLDPGAPGIVPGGAEMLFHFRDSDPAVLAAMGAKLEELVAAADGHPCRVVLEPGGRSVPTPMDEGFQQAIAEAAERHAPGAWRRMPSGAGHDAQFLAMAMPAGMVFVPSIGGISHHWSEDTKEEDIVLGGQVMADAAAALLAS